jgi:hypothetical protein
MPVVNLKASAVTNADAATQTVNRLAVQGGRLYESVGFVETNADDSIGSIYRMVRVKSNDRISRVLLSNDAITSGAANVGIYEVPAVNGGAVVDADFFASAVSIASAQVHADITHEADAADAGAGYGLADTEKPLWQALGLAADPNKWYDVALTLTAATTAAGTISLKVQEISGN